MYMFKIIDLTNRGESLLKIHHHNNILITKAKVDIIVINRIRRENEIIFYNSSSMIRACVPTPTAVTVLILHTKAPTVHPALVAMHAAPFKHALARTRTRSYLVPAHVGRLVEEVAVAAQFFSVCVMTLAQRTLLALVQSARRLNDLVRLVT